MNRGRRGAVARNLLACAAVLSLLVVSACDACDDICDVDDPFYDPVECSGVRLAFAILGIPLSRGGAAQDAYVAVQAQRGGAGSAFVAPPFDLWPPFDVSVAFGIFDPAAGEMGPFGARGCLRTESLDFATAFALCAELFPGRIELEANATTAPLTGTLVLTGASRAELRIEADGDSVSFYGRELGDSTWSLVDSTPFADPAEALRPVVAAVPVPELSEVGFDSPHFSSAAPPDPTEEESVAHEIQQALSDALEAGLLLDGVAQDPAGAETLLDSAAGHLAAAQAGAAAFTGPAKKAKGKIKKAVKSFAKARAQLEALKIGKSQKTFAKAGKSCLRALTILLPTPEL